MFPWKFKCRIKLLTFALLPCPSIFSLLHPGLTSSSSCILPEFLCQIKCSTSSEGGKKKKTKKISETLWLRKFDLKSIIGKVTILFNSFRRNMWRVSGESWLFSSFTGHLMMTFYGLTTLKWDSTNSLSRPFLKDKRYRFNPELWQQKTDAMIGCWQLWQTYCISFAQNSSAFSLSTSMHLSRRTHIPKCSF